MKIKAGKVAVVVARLAVIGFMYCASMAVQSAQSSPGDLGSITEAMQQLIDARQQLELEQLVELRMRHDKMFIAGDSHEVAQVSAKEATYRAHESLLDNNSGDWISQR
jgi:hypothetical protein